jgi:hypothetical protein
MLFDVVFSETDQVRGVDQSNLRRLFFSLLDRNRRRQRVYSMTTNHTDNGRLGNLAFLFTNFIREREMLYGARPATIRFYRKGWTAFERQWLPTTLEKIKTARGNARIWLGHWWGKQRHQSVASLL